MNSKYIYQMIEIDEARIDETCSAYFKWKDLNTYVKSNSSRGINIPDVITEPMGCYCLNLVWNRAKAGDATETESGKIFEFKATSRFDGDLSSFGPEGRFDDLVFLRFNLDENILYVYDLKTNSEDFKKLQANKNQTIEEQQLQGRRPHISLKSLFVDKFDLSPDIIFDIRRCKKYARGSKEYNEIFGRIGK